MSWQAIGSIAELVGAVGVIISLLYLAVQIRQSTKATKVATAHAISAAVREWNQPMLEDADLSWTFTVGTEDPARLDERERSRFYQICFSFFRMFEDVHYQYEHGVLEAEIREGYKLHYAAYAKAPGMLAYWNLRRHTYHPRFRDFLDMYEPPRLARIGALVGGTAWRGEEAR